MTGVADLPLHYGHVPDYLLKTMRGMCDAIIHTMLYEYGEDKLLERLSNPMWFQALNNAIGMDWDSSGSTTVLLSILKQVIKPKEGLAVFGGKGRASLSVKDELGSATLFDIEADKLLEYSSLSAKVDSVLLQDGYNLYIHYMLVSKTGRWLVIQQGMNPYTKYARRYHLLDVENFECAPNSAISGIKGTTINLIDKGIEKTRKVVLEEVNGNKNKIIRDYSKAFNILKGNNTLELFEKNAAISGFDRTKRIEYYRPISIQKLKRNLEKIKNDSFSSLSDSLLGGLTASTARAMFLVADLIYNEPPSFLDPVNYSYDPFKYAFAIGGKDGVPYSVNRKVAEEVIESMKQIVINSKIEDKSKKRSIYKVDRLHRFLNI
ncbi:MAG: protein of unknown function DUF763 [Candidatus Parvarchaeum acidiphilum ARMAN-4]|uniref:DUF763 domain-containing protein n=1 Tax=Candidatus Parvarchaeum acidiphilum ARMAN-4 TaxID=662760 RepID=D2EFV0_PARA4|nr:MAG: protein of unknown function DUF763 [Candidatus Parvarchaeum acidiphilum ARMAN-4]